MFRALPWATRTPIWIASLATSTKFCSVLRPAVDVPTREEFKRLCLKALSDKKDTMKLDHIMEDVMFAFDLAGFAQAPPELDVQKLWFDRPRPRVSVSATPWP